MNKIKAFTYPTFSILNICPRLLPRSSTTDPICSSGTSTVAICKNIVTMNFWLMGQNFRIMIHIAHWTTFYNIFVTKTQVMLDRRVSGSNEFECMLMSCYLNSAKFDIIVPTVNFRNNSSSHIVYDFLHISTSFSEFYNPNQLF